MGDPHPKRAAAHSAERIIDAVLRTLDAEAAAIAALGQAARDDLGPTMAAAIEVIRKSEGRLILTGMGKSGHVARKIAATFASTGTPAYFVHPSEASHGDLGMITPQDVIMALSWSGETAELKNVIAHSRRFSIHLIAVTGNPDSTLAKAADIALLLPPVREACPHNLAPTTSTLIQLALGDALAIALLESRGFTASEFGLLHPGGKLGAMLKFVRDIMHSGAETPLVPQGTNMAGAVMEMSAKGYGCVGITGRQGELVGIITDGDLRRHMRHDLLDAKVESVMTKNPKTIAADQLASEALNILNTAKVQALIVTEKHKPIGIIRFHDILRAGVI